MVEALVLMHLTGVMNFQTELETLIRARYPILYILSSEETRVQSIIMDIASKRQKKVFEWSYSTGIVPAGTSIQSQKLRNAATKDPIMALDQVIEQVEPAMFIFKDFHPFLTKNNYAVTRKLKEIALHLKNSFKTIVLVSPVLEIPTELEKEITLLNHPPPSRDDLAELLDKIIVELNWMTPAGSGCFRQPSDSHWARPKTYSPKSSSKTSA
jgi:hypothetical protein